ncbi:MAG: dTDP-4-dehydrorhamnose reductase [Acidobacteria bacterium]|nr:dTDP-4-dehydrorhamnose reductase [Acidobacteriota bacterium]MBW4046270.1 dTDP-4-dehydrorhamnose reductase [Acidobacteriota bacterium]
MRILVTGVNGQLGRELCPMLSKLGKVVALGRDGCDLGNADEIRASVQQLQPDVIVNPAAYTNVNGAETDRERAMAINGVAPGIFAEEAAKMNALFLHYSTDYVFDGEKAGEYLESDAPNPLNVYGATKLAGEQAVMAAGGRSLVLRTSWVYSAHGANFVRSILRLAAEREELSIVDDQVGAPTSTPDLARATVRLIEQCAGVSPADFPSGIYHATAAGHVSWCGFATEIVKLAGKSAPVKTQQVKPIPSASYPTPAQRPMNSRLSNQKLHDVFGFNLPQWQSSLEEVMHQIGATVAR